ncbi:hypothetical protein EXIGUO8H_20369 [Exiguobacterium sp. 8H]|uniref:hypothetical protein n=1 Tax=unclassified Exiguobacterium TaxID=2644629 RepID=UPI0012F2FFE7|nr:MULTISPECIES: hypothetical protein [unclassified Exiguobacterium]VXB52935.1 hypothetical protein EXIGUO8A_11438 [Exiguobacterium sp. 8A]VXB53560.1 hypothetical protein EXIGUO8H_20369 [Exiguobacterium sp. 8H]
MSEQLNQELTGGKLKSWQRSRQEIEEEERERVDGLVESIKEMDIPWRHALQMLTKVTDTIEEYERRRIKRLDQQTAMITEIKDLLLEANRLTLKNSNNARRLKVSVVSNDENERIIIELPLATLNEALQQKAPAGTEAD